MRMPGFTADNALYRTRGRYATTYLPGTAGKAEIVPQLYREGTIVTTPSYWCYSTSNTCYCTGALDCDAMQDRCSGIFVPDGKGGGSCRWK
jgi:hypothetical protein